MLYFNVLSSDGFFTTQHGRYTDEQEAQRHADALRSQGINAYVAAWRDLA